MIICNPGIKPKNRHIQSILASSKIRLLKLKNNNPVKTQEKTEMINTRDAVLQGFYSQTKKAKSLYILLHGWEGSADSTYIQLLANSLYKNKKASIFRLNFRDHGDTHHLNKELFHSCRLAEVVEAVEQICQKYDYESVYLCGFSLGANFCLRVAAKINSRKTRLTKVFAISPPLVPINSMAAIEKSWLYSNYFIKKWTKSLVKKQKHFPELFDDSQYLKIKSLRELTEKMIIMHSDYENTDAYFEDYRISKEIIKEIKTPCHIISSWDDPVIPFDDFIKIDKKKNIKLVTSKYGGHCGFINSWTLHSWIEQYIIENSNEQ